MLVNRAALCRDVRPQRRERLLQTGRAVDDQELGRLQPAGDEIVEQRPPGGLALAAHVAHGQQHLLPVATDTEDNQQRDRCRLLVQPDAHDGAVQDQPDDIFLAERALRPGLPVGLHLPPHPAHRVLADRSLEQRRERTTDATRVRPGEVGSSDQRFHLLGHPGVARHRPAFPLGGPAAGGANARPRHGDLYRPEAAGDPPFAMTVPVTGERRDIGRLDSRRAVRRARFAIAAPMPAFVPSSSQRRGQLLLDQLFNEAPDPIPDPRFDRIRPSSAQKQLRVVHSRRAIRRHGVISPAPQRRSWLIEQAGDYATPKFQPLPRRHRQRTVRSPIRSASANAACWPQRYGFWPAWQS